MTSLNNNLVLYYLIKSIDYLELVKFSRAAKAVLKGNLLHFFIIFIKLILLTTGSTFLVDIDLLSVSKYSEPLTQTFELVSSVLKLSYCFDINFSKVGCTISTRLFIFSKRTLIRR